MTVVRLLELLEEIDDKTKEVIVAGDQLCDILDIEEEDERITLHTQLKFD